jgi:hypothetical protein
MFMQLPYRFEFKTKSKKYKSLFFHKGKEAFAWFIEVL